MTTRARLPRTADVYRQGVHAGVLERTTAGAVFTYDPPPVESIAYRLPLQRGSSATRIETRGVNLHPFFAGLLPEGARMRALVRRVKTSEDDLMSLLVAAGEDCIGDVSVLPSGAPPTASTAAETLKLDEVLFAELFAKSLAAPNEPTIAGVQDKVSASMISFPLRMRGAAYILKLNPADMPRLVENEHFFLQMARACGLPAATSTLVHDRDENAGLLVERFDRIKEAGADLRKLHQEDACQFLERYPADKYLVTCSEIATALTELATVPIVEMARLLRLVAFSYLIANGDLHAKNISLFTAPKTSRIALTPAYDLLSTLPYGDRTMAMQLDGRDDNLKSRTFLAFGLRHGVRERATRALLDELCDLALPWIARLEEIGLPKKKTTDLARVMKKRRDDLR
ncbi:MAG: Serine/threonine-protein kinase HipA [Myxococcaceae bacterium]|nr:Serine/threonine-protein kinase HipA [Myxococcaceae bacterium]